MDKYIEFLREKGCVTEGIQDVFIKNKDGSVEIKQIMATKIDHKAKYYVEFCRLHKLDIQEVFTFSYEVGEIKD